MIFLKYDQTSRTTQSTGEKSLIYDDRATSVYRQCAQTILRTKQHSPKNGQHEKRQLSRVLKTLQNLMRGSARNTQQVGEEEKLRI